MISMRSEAANPLVKNRVYSHQIEIVVQRISAAMLMI